MEMAITHDALRIVLQHWMLPTGFMHNQHFIWCALEQTLPNLREKLIFQKWHRFNGTQPTGRKTDSEYMVLEKKYIEEIGFIDEKELSDLLIRLRSFPLSNIFNMCGAQSIDDHYSPSDFLSANAFLTGNFFNPTAWAIQHKIITILGKIFNDDFPKIASSVIGWMQRQQKRYQRNKGLVVYQLTASQRWQKRMDVVELLLQSLLLFPITLEERIFSVGKLDIVKCLCPPGGSMTAKTIPSSLLKPILKAVYDKCVWLIEFISRNGSLDIICSSTQSCITRLANDISELNNIQTSGLSLSNQVHQITNKLQRDLQFHCIEALISARMPLIEYIPTIMDETTEGYVIINDRIINCIYYSHQPLSIQSYPLVLETVYTATKELLSYGFMSMFTTQRFAYPKVVQSLRKELTSLLKNSCYLHHYKTYAIQEPECFEPWSSIKVKAVQTSYLEYGDCEPLQLEQVFSFVAVLLVVHMVALNTTQKLIGSSDSNSESGLDKSTILYSHHQSALATMALKAIMMTLTYLNDAEKLTGRNYYERRQYHYHQVCYDIAKDAVTLRQSLMEIVTACCVNGSSCVGFTKLLYIIAVNADQSEFICDDLVSVNTIMTALFGVFDDTVIVVESILDMRQMTIEDLIPYIMLIVIFVAAHTVILYQYLSKFHLHVMDVINVERDAYHTQGTVKMITQNSYESVIFDHMDVIVDIADTVKISVLKACVHPLDEMIESRAMECLSFSTLAFNILRFNAAKISRIESHMRDGTLDRMVKEDVEQSKHILNTELTLAMGLQDRALETYQRWKLLFESHSTNRITLLMRQLQRMEMTLLEISSNRGIQTNQWHGRDNESRRSKSDLGAMVLLSIVIKGSEQLYAMLGMSEASPETCTRQSLHSGEGNMTGSDIVITHYTSPTLTKIFERLKVINESLNNSNIGGISEANANIDLIEVYLFGLEKCLNMMLMTQQMVGHYMLPNPPSESSESNQTSTSHVDDVIFDMENKSLETNEIVILQKIMKTILTSDEFIGLHQLIISSPLLEHGSDVTNIDAAYQWLQSHATESPRSGKVDNILHQYHVGQEEYDRIQRQTINDWHKKGVEADINHEKAHLNDIITADYDSNTIILLKLLGLR